MTPSSPVRFPHLNLARNPFGELTAEERGRLAVCELDEPLTWLRADRPGNRILEFLGPCGHGKSSHLLALSRRLNLSSPDSRWLGQQPVRVLYVPPRGPYPAIPAAGWLLVDEADRAPWRMRRRLWRAGRLLAIAAHRSQTRCVTSGRLLRTVRVGNRGNAVRLQTMLNRRITASRARPELPAPQIHLRDAARLIERFGDDIRGIEDYLYERFQQLAGSGDGEVRFDI